MKIHAYIKQTYPFYHGELKKVFLIICCIAAASFLFSYLFEPFNVNATEHKIDSYLIVALHSIIPIPIAFIYSFFLKTSVQNHEDWTLGKEFLHLAIILFLIGLANFLIRDFIYEKSDNWSFRYLYEEIRNTFLTGILLLSIIIPLNLERLIYEHIKAIRTLPLPKKNFENNTSIQIHTPIEHEKFHLHVNSFLFAKVESNYLEVFFLGPNGVEKQLKRLPLKKFYDQLSSFPSILKVHRSYIVNLNAIKSVSGNAQGYLLYLKEYPQKTIPVSRSKIEEFNRVYTNLYN